MPVNSKLSWSNMSSILEYRVRPSFKNSPKQNKTITGREEGREGREGRKGREGMERRREGGKEKGREGGREGKKEEKKKDCSI